MSQHTHLPAMVGFVREHVAQHFRTNRPWPGPAVSAKPLDAGIAAERLCQHLRATSGALGQSRAGLLRRALRAVELSWSLKVRSCKPDPFAADIVHVSEDRRDGPDLAALFGSRSCCPGGRVKTLDEYLVDAIVNQEDLGGRAMDFGLAELSADLGLTRGHGRSLTFPRGV